MLVETLGSAEDATCVLEAESGKLDTKDANLFMYLSVYPLVLSSH